MDNYRLMVDLQFDSEETAVAFAAVLSKTMQITAKTTLDVSESEEAHIILGATTLRTCSEFVPNDAA